MNRILFVVWLVSLAVAFHLGWWGRWRMNQRLKRVAEDQMRKAKSEGAKEMILYGIMSSYWGAL